MAGTFTTHRVATMCLSLPELNPTAEIKIKTQKKMMALIRIVTSSKLRNDGRRENHELRWNQMYASENHYFLRLF